MIRFSELDQSKYYLRLLDKQLKVKHVHYTLYSYLNGEIFSLVEKDYKKLLEDGGFVIINQDLWGISEEESYSGVISINAGEYDKLDSLYLRQGKVTHHALDSSYKDGYRAINHLTMDMEYDYNVSAEDALVLPEDITIHKNALVVIRNKKLNSIIIPKGILAVQLFNCWINQLILPESCKELELNKSNVGDLQEYNLRSFSMWSSNIYNFYISNGRKLVYERYYYSELVNNMHGNIKTVKGIR